MDFTLILTIFIVGALFGSFTNVIIYRIPRKISLLHPSSRCPKCGHKIKWSENVPILSYVLLKGKCRSCATSISLMYPLVEFIMGILFVIIYAFNADIFQFSYVAFVVMMLISISIIDYKHFIIPDVLLIFTAVISIIYYIVTQELNIIDHFLSAIILFTIMFLLRFFSSRFFKKEGLGMGDIKLATLIGFLIGWKAALLAIFFGFVLASIVLSILFLFRLVSKNSYVPFGPFMIGGMFLYLFWGNLIIDWYIHFASGL